MFELIMNILLVVFLGFSYFTHVLEAPVPVKVQKNPYAFQPDTWPKVIIILLEICLIINIIQIIKKNPADVDALLEQTFYKDESTTIGDMVKAATAEIGEKISVRRFARYEATTGTVDTYIHMGGKVGVLIEAAGVLGENAAEVIHDCALQVAAASPVAPEYVRREEVRADHLEHEKEILVAQARNEGKPEKIIEKMVEGRIKKFYQDVCLLEQAFVKDGDISVQTMINQKAKGLEIVRFTRYKMGDGLEKKVNDLAAEVAEQTAKMGL